MPVPTWRRCVRAERHGSVYRVNGQKIWSTLAHHADYCLLLVRTDTSGPKQAGISFLLMDMRSKGVTVRPIRQITGDEEFGEIFLDDVEVPVSNRLGAENEGWRVAQTTLTSERGITILELSERLHHARRRLAALLAGDDGRGATISIGANWSRSARASKRCVGWWPS